MTTPIVVTDGSRWILDARGFLTDTGTINALPFPIVGAIRRRHWPLRPVLYTPADLARIGHTLPWRGPRGQQIMLCHPWGKAIIPWNFTHWMIRE